MHLLHYNHNVHMSPSVPRFGLAHVLDDIRHLIDLYFGIQYGNPGCIDFQIERILYYNHVRSPYVHICVVIFFLDYPLL